MKQQLLRREFLKAVSAAAAVSAQGRTEGKPVKTFLEPFDYQGVQLLPSPWQRQVSEARGFYLALANDDVLKGFRTAAGLPRLVQPSEAGAREIHRPSLVNGSAEWRGYPLPRATRNCSTRLSS